jgi:CMP-N,N'-diacetyllegionaminic acid synthase
MIIYIDIDETICNTPESRDYKLSEPILEHIEKANKLYDEGHRIIYWTARGTVTNIDWYDHTYKQLHFWGVKFHDLKMAKPHYDILIDDKNINSLFHWNEKEIERVYDYHNQ